MINVRVIRFQDIVKYSIGFVLLLIVALCFTKIITGEKTKEKSPATENPIPKELFSKTAMTSCLGEVVTAMEEVQEEPEEQENLLQKVFGIQLSAMDNKNKEKENKKVENNVVAKEPESLPEAQTGITTEVIDQSGINTKFTNEYGSVKVKNESKYELTEEMLSPNIELTNKKDIILYHTHTCESYTPSQGYEYEQTGNYRTTDLNFSVSRVGNELANYLKNYGYHVIHDTTYHDYPAYSGSYNRSLTTIQNQLSASTTTQMVFDIHRDAVGANSNYAPTVKIGEEYAAQIMFVIGTDGGGLSHPNWQQNLKFAIKLQEKANELYPGLMKPIILRNSRYNQHVTNAATIIEVGATGNTMEQCLASMKYFSKVFSEVVK